MIDFKFFNTINENDAVEPNDNIIREVVFIPSETTQIYTQMLRIDIPINEMTEDHLNQLKISNENMLLNQISDTLDFRHEIISVDGNGFTIRSELFL